MSCVIFWDMHSGGSLKNGVSRIYVDHCTLKEAVKLFKKRYGDPDNVTCDCCGPDYSVSEYETFEEAAEFHGDTKDSPKIVYIDLITRI